MTSDPYAVARKRMIQEQLIPRGITDKRVLDVMGRIHRDEFVDEALKNQAYIDAPLSIGAGQTISQPYMVALMTQELRLSGNESVLEIGTGSGYQTVILASLARKVYTIERHKALAMKARRQFKALGLTNIVMCVGDGSRGWPEKAPFDRILVTCAAPEIPQNMVAQLTVSGIILVPVTTHFGYQELMRITKTNHTQRTEALGGCHFVKLVGEYGYHE